MSLRYPLASVHKNGLLQLARTTVINGCDAIEPKYTESALLVESEYSQISSCFVTLNALDKRNRKKLRGCVGSLIANQPLAIEVMKNAYSAAFLDTRFNPVQLTEITDIRIEISVLGVQRKCQFSSEADLINQLKPGEDGIILRYGSHRATLLPSVWGHTKNTQDFLKKLKIKAGLKANFWNEKIHIFRFSSEEFGEV